jgi:hypothetical protein
VLCIVQIYNSHNRRHRDTTHCLHSPVQRSFTHYTLQNDVPNMRFHIFLPFHMKNTLLYTTPWSTVLPEKLKRPELLKKFPVFYGTRRFITAFTEPIPILSQTDPVHAHHPTSRRSILILTSHLCLGLASGLLPSTFLTNTLYVFLVFSHACYIPCPS